MPRKPPILLAAALASAALASSAGAQTPADIEGVWSFSGGQVTVQPLLDGTLQGTIVRETRLSHCEHPIGEQMWVGIRPVGDGSYVGGHQWFDTITCAPRELRGNSAFRVLAREDGARFLRACLSPPERPTEQPAIAPDGTAMPPGVDCHDSDLIRPRPTAEPALRQIAKLPRATKRRQCRLRRPFEIRLRQPSGDALATATITVDGKRLRTLSGDRLTEPVSLKRPPKGRYKVRIEATTVLGHTVTGTRKYRSCNPKEQRRKLARKG